MLACSLIGLLSGLLLGGRFKVLATIPVQFAVLITAGSLAACGRLSLGEAALIIAAFCLSLQAGYVVMLVSSGYSTRVVRTTPSKA